VAIGLQHLLEGVLIDVHHDRAEHLHQSPVGVVDELLVAGQRHHAGHRLLVQADVQHRVHHAGHGELGAGAAGDQQRVAGIAEHLASGGFGGLHRGQLLLPQPLGELLARGQVGVAGLGGDGEAGGHRQLAADHVGQARALAAQQRPHAVPTAAHILLGFVHLGEQVDPFVTHNV
jgi:hypothetical protein